MIHTMRTDIPYYRNKGIEGFYTQTSGDWARLGLNAYVSSKLCWNADLNVEDLLDDYFQKFYGPASVPMKDFFMIMEKSMQEWNGCASYGLYGVGGLKIIALDILKPAVTAQMEKDLAKAEQLTANDFTSAERVGMVRKAFDVSMQELKNIEAESKLKKKN
jgi:hypothetical protein